MPSKKQCHKACRNGEDLYLVYVQRQLVGGGLREEKKWIGRKKSPKNHVAKCVLCANAANEQDSTSASETSIIFSRNQERPEDKIKVDCQVALKHATSIHKNSQNIEEDEDRNIVNNPRYQGPYDRDGFNKQLIHRNGTKYDENGLDYWDQWKKHAKENEKKYDYYDKRYSDPSKNNSNSAINNIKQYNDQHIKKACDSFEYYSEKNETTEDEITNHSTTNNLSNDVVREASKIKSYSIGSNKTDTINYDIKDNISIEKSSNNEEKKLANTPSKFITANIVIIFLALSCAAIIHYAEKIDQKNYEIKKKLKIKPMLRRPKSLKNK